MADSFGVSFVPGAQGNQNNQNGAGVGGVGSSPNPIQQAIQMLSLRLPRVMGANGMAPGPLLRAPGGMGISGAGLNGAAMSPLLQALLRLAGMGNVQPGGAMGSPSMGGASPTRVSPGTAGNGVWEPGEPRQAEPDLPWIPERPPGGPVEGMPGPGMPTFPPTGGGPTADRSNPLPRNPTGTTWNFNDWLSGRGRGSGGGLTG